jgi:predicted ATP-binding protein involved in virulence
MLSFIKIEQLFDAFDYTIELKKEGVTILTGPNGYGKTTILKIIDALATKDILFFLQLPFKRITLEFSNHKQCSLVKNEDGISFLNEAEEEKTIIWNQKSIRRVFKSLPFLEQIGENRWFDHRNDKFFNTTEVLQKILPEFSSELPEFHELSEHQEFLRSALLHMPEVYFIREQRLLRLTDNKRTRTRIRFTNEEDVTNFNNTIEEYARELSDLIKDTLAKSSQITQELDGSFPRRLFEQKIEIVQDEFNERFDKVKEIQKNLNEYGLYDLKEDSHPVYSSENARALYVYIEDTEKKLKIFAEILEKLKLFTNILNNRRFAFKRIHISKDDGFTFTNKKNKLLALSDLSSGEQQEVVILYELLFRVKPDTLVLIDEPELSLHVAWQMQFLDDLFEIIKWQKINVIVATHSPQIIGNKWDLVIDLWDLQNDNKSEK